MAVKVPKTIQGVRVEQRGDPIKVKGETWVTLSPADEYDERLWEFSLSTGRILETRG